MESDGREQLHIAGVEYPEARKLADLVSIQRDLQAVQDACTRIMNMMQENVDDHLLHEALWTSALVRYIRCFSHGKRYGLDESIFEGLQGDPVGTHRWYKNIRDKHIAHSVNPYEQVLIGIVLSPPEADEKKVLGVSMLAGVYISPDIEGVRQLGMLANVILKKIGPIAAELNEQVLGVAKAEKIEDLYSKANNRFVAPGPDKAGVARK